MLGKWMDGWKEQRSQEGREEGLGPSDHDHYRSNDSSLSQIVVSHSVCNVQIVVSDRYSSMFEPSKLPSSISMNSGELWGVGKGGLALGTEIPGPPQAQVLIAHPEMAVSCHFTHSSASRKARL